MVLDRAYVLRGAFVLALHLVQESGTDLGSGRSVSGVWRGGTVPTSLAYQVRSYVPTRALCNARYWYSEGYCLLSAYVRAMRCPVLTEGASWYQAQDSSTTRSVI